ncbi:MAG TPA: bifunctional shikimate kinase/3-dehydroquinate synthase [Candidatus Limnocylindrales bacterium]|nr:bifunctional shikimate kinase/3-dehydroquinate synthase [Candidatus Limnocylindrales bacterium]
MSDGIVLVGPPGAGKSSIGRSLAAAMGRRFVDTDELIAGPNGNAGDRMRALGEPAFRETEARAISDALADATAVIATGGGALDDPLNRWRLWHHGVTLRLDAPDHVLLARLAADPVERPLLDGDPVAAMAGLRQRREAFYRAADIHVDTDASRDRIVGNLVDQFSAGTAVDGRPRRLFDARVSRHHVIGPTMARLVYGRRLQPTLLTEMLAGVGGDPAFIVDAKVTQVAAPQPERTLVLRGGEANKRMASLRRVLEWMAAQRVERSDPVAAIGGGSIGDLAGLAAALYARGIPWIDVPTTWLSQADAALGGKVAVNLRAGKNAVGAFWPPSAVVADVDVLDSLPRREARNGMAESVKAALVGDPVLWRLIEDRGSTAIDGDEEARYAIIERAARVKMAIVDRDPFEADERRQLNLGHTIGHALEVVARYRLPHGAAVALGLCVAAQLGAVRGGDPELPSRLGALVQELGFAIRHPGDPRAVRDALGADKKRRAGRQRWILPMAIGQVIEVDDVTDAELDMALRCIGIGA